MLFKQCNIDRTDRINRVIIGAIIALAACFGMSRLFFIMLGIVLVIEGLIGWCSIPYIMHQVKHYIRKK